MPIDFAAVDAALISAQPILAVTLYPAAGILALVFGSEAHRLGADTQHDLSDYTAAADDRLSGVDPANRRTLRRVPSLTPIHDELAAEPVRLSDEGAHAIARQWLREIAAEQSGDIVWTSTAERDPDEHPASGHHVQWDGSCWPDCPACARDLTGAFPVGVAA